MGEKMNNIRTPLTIRLAHFSDIHVTAPACVWRPSDWFNKRLSAWINLRILGRGLRFRHTDRVLATLVQELHTRRYDHLIFSGDATAMGFEEELARAAHLLGLGRPGCHPGLAVPGNHDYCTPAAMNSGHFERYFGPWQIGERVGDDVYPFAQRAGSAWLVALNSSTATRWPWDARGAVRPDELDRLDALLQRLGHGPRILVTHYPVWLPNGQREWKTRALRNLDAVLEVARRGGVSLWLHGHRHHPYYMPPSNDAPFPIICAGSATQKGRWSYSEYTLRGHHLRVTRRIYLAERGCFIDGETHELKLNHGILLTQTSASC
jgi:3',5'-cyclic AMP phosphodiesterase CpdA